MALFPVSISFDPTKSSRYLAERCQVPFSLAGKGQGEGQPIKQPHCVKVFLSSCAAPTDDVVSGTGSSAQN
jgi:hypothetical protein